MIEIIFKFTLFPEINEDNRNQFIYFLPKKILRIIYEVFQEELDFLRYRNENRVFPEFDSEKNSRHRSPTDKNN
jgi:hypothetical protein